FLGERSSCYNLRGIQRKALMPRRTLGLLFAAALSVSSSAFGMNWLAADTPAASPSSAPTTQPVESLQIEITAVEGNVQVRAAEDQPWQRAKVGMIVDENAEFRTSLR